MGKSAATMESRRSLGATQKNTAVREAQGVSGEKSLRSRWR